MIASETKYVDCKIEDHSRYAVGKGNNLFSSICLLWPFGHVKVEIGLGVYKIRQGRVTEWSTKYNSR
jgi:diadenosine tetraphosphatase ApaH/serine/threonine PP2A family protein phosphatase